MIPGLFTCGIFTMNCWSLSIIVILFGLHGFGATASTCPAVCFCPSLTRTVYCPRKELLFIPSGIPSDSIQLNLNDNTFSNPVISKANFTRYRDLQQLYLTGCGIEYIEVDTFIDNKKLKWLDIGKNKLKTISDYTFRDLTLDHLFLNDNPGVTISTRAFGGLRTTGLYLQKNGLDKLSLEVIRPMNGTLKTLWLHGNKFERFNSLWLYMFKTLSHLRIGVNPLHCNCEARWLMEFYQTNKRIFEGGPPPSCSTPVRLRGKNFSELQEDDFKCQLPVFKNVDVILEHNVGKMTCLASGDPVPTIYWMKPDGDSEVFIPKSETKDMEGIMYVTPPEANSKNRYQCVANNPAGNVTFSINVGWPSVPKYNTDIDQSEVAMNDISADVKDIDVKDKGDHKKKHNDVKIETKVIHVNTNSSKVTANDMQAVTQETSRTGVQFTAGDIVGAVVGTFLITLLLCIIVFHVFYRHQRKSGYPNPLQNGITTPDLRKGPPSRNELDEVEHTMLERRTFDIHV